MPHCSYAKLGPHTMVGDRDMGDTSFDVDGTIFAWFDRWLKGDPRRVPGHDAACPLFRDGREPVEVGRRNGRPRTRSTLRLYLRSDGHANSLYGDGRLDAAAAAGERGRRPLSATIR